MTTARADAPAALNHLVLTAVLQERSGLRYTPAGIPVLDAVLKHESDVCEGKQVRKISMEIRAKAVGDASVLLGRQTLGSQGHYGGFLANGRNGKGVVFHLTDLDFTASSPTI
jgi:primosomal replication protein N